MTPTPAVPRRFRPFAARRAGVFALVLAATLLGSTGAGAASIMRTVYDIEAGHGNDPAEVISLLRPLEAAARASGGDDLRAFLAAWGYAHGAVDKPAVADAAIEELTDIGERTHDPAALASAYALKATMLSFAGQKRAAFGWIELAEPLSDQTTSLDVHYWVDSTAADLAMANGQIDEGIRLAEKGAAAARDSHNPRREAQSYQTLVPLRLAKGDTANALREAALIRTLGARSTDPGLVVSGWVMEAFAAVADDQPALALHARQMAVETQHVLAAKMPASSATVNSQAGGPAWLSTELETMLTFSALHLSAHNYAKAHDFAQRALAQSEAVGDDDSRAHAQIDLGMADVALGHVALGKQEAGAGLAALEKKSRDAELLIQLNRYTALLERNGESNEALVRLRESLLLENELARHDRQSTVVALQRKSSYEQHLRQLDQLEHDNAMQLAEIARRNNERNLMLALAAALMVGLGRALSRPGYATPASAGRALDLPVLGAAPMKA